MGRRRFSVVWALALTLILTSPNELREDETKLYEQWLSWQKKMTIQPFIHSFQWQAQRA